MRRFTLLGAFAIAVFATSCDRRGENSAPPPRTNTHLVHIVHMGQSLASGDDAFPVVSTVDSGAGNLSFKRGVHTWREQDKAYGQHPEKRPDCDFNLIPILGGDRSTSTGETIANGLVDSLTAALGKPADTRFLFSFSGIGSKRLRDLDKAHDNTTDPRSLRPTPGGFYKTSIDDVRRAKAQATARGWSYSVMAITWMQGEKNNDQRLDDWSAPLDRTTFLQRYATDLIELKNQWNTDILTITGQTKRIPLFSYQTWGSVSGSSQLLASDQDSEIYVVSPTYYMYSALNSINPLNGQWGNWIHLDGDSERWLGAQFAKVIKRVLMDGEKWMPLRPVKAWTSSDRLTVYVQYSVPRPPLVIDTSFMPASPGAGLYIPGGPNIASATVSSADTITLKLASPLPAGLFAVEYASQHGNSVALHLSETIKSVQPISNGHAGYQVTFQGDLTSKLATIVSRGVFYLSTTESGTALAKGVIRRVALDSSGNTVMTGEIGELWNGVQFKAGQTVEIRSVVPFGNVRDSDPAESLYKFTTGPRVGQPYPLWNWSVGFEGLAIDANQGVTTNSR